MQGEWPKSTIPLEMIKSEYGAEMSSLRRPWGRLEGLGQRAGAGGVKKNTSSSGSGQGALGSLLQVREWKSSSLVVDGGLPARERAGVDSGGLGYPGRAPMWGSTRERGPKSKRLILTRVENSKSGGAPTIMRVAGRGHSVAVFDGPG